MSISAKELLGPLDGQEFKSYRDLQINVLRYFNERIEEVAPGYTYQDLIDWAERKKWIVPVDTTGFLVHIGGGNGNGHGSS
jgi:FAD/FMN-containing dehydrogenase